MISYMNHVRYFAGYRETLISFPRTAHPNKNHTLEEFFSSPDKTEHSYHVASPLFVLLWLKERFISLSTQNACDDGGFFEMPSFGFSFR